MKKQLPCTHTLKIGLFLCGLLPLGLLAVATVRTTGQLVILVFAIVLVCVFSFWFSRFIAARYAGAAGACLESGNLDAQMTHMEKMANMGRLAADMTHELNNPLQLILSQASWIEELLGDEEPSLVKNRDEYLKAVAGIRQQVARATRITGRVLGYTRQENEEQTALQINTLVEETWSFLEKKARNHNIGHVLELDQNLPSILTRGHQLQQVLLNLMDNALDAVGQDGEVSIRTSLDGSHICIEVSDNGPGIPAEVLKRIWLPFFTTKERGKGTGLGLAISQESIRSLGGKLTAHNKAGATGAVFTVKIPIHPEATTSTVRG